MQRWGVLLLAVTCVIGAAACGDDDNNTPAPSNQPLVFTANLSSANEVPAISNAEAGATGTATVTLTPTRDSANAITGGTFRFQFTVRGLTSTSDIRLAHIHTGAAGVNGGVVVDSLLSAATSIPTPAGTASFERADLSANTAATVQAIVANPSQFYFNIHTALNPGGVMRGQLAAQ
jgi:hypothetical protein